MVKDFPADCPMDGHMDGHTDTWKISIYYNRKKAIRKYLQNYWYQNQKHNIQKHFVWYTFDRLFQAKKQDYPSDCPADVFLLRKFEQKCFGNFLKNTLSPGTSYLPFSGFFLRRDIRYWKKFFEQNPKLWLKRQFYFCRNFMLTPAPFVSNKKKPPRSTIATERSSLTYLRL